MFHKYSKIIKISYLCFLAVLIGVGIYLYRVSVPNIKVPDKEAAIAFVNSHQKDLDKLAGQMREEFEKEYEVVEERENKVVLIYRYEFDSYPFFENYKWLKNYRINTISYNETPGSYNMVISFSDTPVGYDYFHICYSENDQPCGWSKEPALVEEEDGIFVQRGSYYRFETAKITNHWYYCQCDTR